MTPGEQLVQNKFVHAGVPFLLDLLALWECVDQSKIPALISLREMVGTAEMRDLCVTLHTPLQACFKEWTRLYGEFEDAFDWEWIPAYVQTIDWTQIRYNPIPNYGLVFHHLPTAEEVNAKLDTPRDLLVIDVIERVEQALRTDDDNQSDRLAAQYAAADTATRAALDEAFINLCGFSMETLLKKESPFK